jgi:hypothetical protein
MKIEDKDRLYQKDLREKNKRKRFEVRYDVEADTRKEGMVEFEREQAMRLNKISVDRYKETLARGFDIITNDPLDNEGDLNEPNPDDAAPQKTQVYEYYRALQEEKRQPRVWSKAMNTVNRGFMSEQEREAHERAEEERKKGQIQPTRANLTEQMRSTNASIGEVEMN